MGFKPVDRLDSQHEVRIPERILGDLAVAFHAPLPFLLSAHAAAQVSRDDQEECHRFHQHFQPDQDAQQVEGGQHAPQPVDQEEDEKDEVQPERLGDLNCHLARPS